MRKVEEVIAEVKENLPEVLKRWQEEPWEFCRDVLRAEPLPWQVTFMRAVSLAKRGMPNSPDGSCKTRFAIKSGTGVGKTFAVSVLILWGLACFPDAKVPVTAPTSPQLKAVLWPELAKWINNIPPGLRGVFPFEHQTDRITMLDNFAVARTARDESPESFQGYHASNVMLVADEASGVPDSIFLAGQGVMAEKGAVTILIGNPTRANGFFFNCFQSPFWWPMTVSCADSPRVTPQYIEEMRQEHGEGSYEFRVRVLGEFHLEDSGVIIPYPWVRDAIDKDIGPDSDYIVWGFDVSDGRDRSALARRCGNRLMEIKSWGGKEALVSVGMVVDEYYNTPVDKRPDEICVDAIGMGATAAQRLAEVLKTEPVVITKTNVALTGAKVGTRFTSHRVELWERGRKWFESNMVTIPPGADRFYKQISSVEWEVKDSNGKWAIVDKHAGGSSPDCFVAGTMVRTFFGETPIEQIKVGQRVLTPSGFRKVIKTWETDAYELTTIRLNNGKSLVGKPKHKVFTKNAGFVRMDAISLASDIESHSNKRILKWMFQKLLYSTGKSFGFKQAAGIINHDTHTTMKDYFTVGSGSSTTGPYRICTIFITLMEIGQIILSQILSAFLALIMGGNTCLRNLRTLNIVRGIALIWIMLSKRQRNGTDLLRGYNGTVDTGRKHGKVENQTFANVSFAGKILNLFLKIKHVIAQRSAQVLIVIKNIKTALANVRNVGKPLCVTDIKQPCSVPISVQTQTVVAPIKTYNLTLDRDNVYYANGVLVDNCADAFLLTFSGLKRGISCFTRDKKGRKLRGIGEIAGIGSASYLPYNGS